VTLFNLVMLLLERPDTTIFRVVMEETVFFNFFFQDVTAQLSHRPPHC